MEETWQVVFEYKKILEQEVPWCVMVCFRSYKFDSEFTPAYVILSWELKRGKLRLRMALSVMEKSAHVFKLLSFKKSIRQSKCSLYIGGLMHSCV